MRVCLSGKREGERRQVLSEVWLLVMAGEGVINSLRAWSGDGSEAELHTAKEKRMRWGHMRLTTTADRSIEWWRFTRLGTW